jgi:hypothetical protein
LAQGRADNYYEKSLICRFILPSKVIIGTSFLGIPTV